MNNSLTRVLLSAITLISLAGSLRASPDRYDEAQSNLPIAPMTVRFQLAPRYFAQLISHDLRYGSIEALIDDDPQKPWYEVILTDKTTGRRIFYLNSMEAVNTLRWAGIIAHFAIIQFSELQVPDAGPAFRIGLSDSFGQEIVWRFLANPRVSEQEVSFSPPLGAPGFVLMHASLRTAAAPGTAVTIGKETNVAEITSPAGAPPSSVPYQAFCATGLVMAEIAPGTQHWTVEASPAQLEDGGSWALRTQGGQIRQLVIERASDSQMLLRQADVGDPFSSPAQLDTLRQDNGIALRSIRFERQAHTLQISFDPALPLPVSRTPGGTAGAYLTANVDFTLDEEHASIARGQVSVIRSPDTEHLIWKFGAPNWARANSFDTGVNVVR